jgi:hypothetical protein
MLTKCKPNVKLSSLNSNTIIELKDIQAGYFNVHKIVVIFHEKEEEKNELGCELWPFGLLLAPPISALT